MPVANFLFENVSAKSKGVPLFYNRGVCPGTGLKIWKLLAEAYA
jgi:hypothetical protein